MTIAYPYPLKTFRKSAVDRRRLYMSYECWLADDEKLIDFQIIVDPYTTGAPIVVDCGYTDAMQKMLTMFVAGGEINTRYVLAATVRTDSGQIKRDLIGIAVTS